MLLVELAKEAGVPDGCINIVHGQHDTVNFICDNPDIKAISFVGSDQAGKYIMKEDVRTAKECKQIWEQRIME